VVVACGGDFRQQGQDDRPAAVDDALPTQLDHVQLGERAEHLVPVRAGEKLPIH
jgi:hypothetical protein